jgi:hypothetical protein
MKLGKLLGAGKSFVNGGRAVAYREDKRAYLPKFGSQKNPFASAVQTELPKAAEVNSVAPAKKIAAPVLKKTQKMPAVSGTPKSLAVWTSKLNPLTLLRGAPEEIFSPRPQQAELSLEKVKVVHNDLTDAEVEIVPIKSRPAREADAAASKAPGKSWSALGERIFGANAT